MDFISCMWWALAVAVFYSAIIVPIQMEMAVAKPSRSTEGKLLLKKEGIILRVCYRTNYICAEENMFASLEYPYNTCSLYGGIWWGNFSALFWFLFRTIILCIGLIMCFVEFLFYVITTILGFAPDCAVINDKFPELAFHPYECFGKNHEKKFIAPWKFIVLILSILFAKEISRFLSVAAMSSQNFLFSKTALYFAVIIAFLLAFGWIISKARKKEAWPATREILKAKWKKICLETEVV